MFPQVKWHESGLCLLFTAMATVALAHEPVNSLEQLPVLVTRGDTVTVGDSPGETAGVTNADSVLLKGLDQVASPAAGPADTWDTLPSMSSGTPLRLMLTGGSEVIGRLASANAEAVVLENSRVRKGRHGRWIVASTPRTFRRSEVSSVEKVTGWPFWAKFALWAGIIYVAAGVIAGSIVGNS